MEKELFELYKSYTSDELIPNYELITGSGSNRSYYRIVGKKNSYIGVKGESLPENHAFISLAKHFKKKGLPVPEVYTVSNDEQFYLQEDLGKTSLFDIIQKRNKNDFSLQDKDILLKTIRLLPHIQYEGAEGLDFSICYPVSEFDKKTVFWDLNYFKYCFLKLSSIDFSEVELEKEFEKLAHNLLKEDNDTFMYRDFQSRNVMIKNGNPYFIDFQGGRKGPVYYDVASFVWQAKANFSKEERKELIDSYLSELQKFKTIDSNSFYKQLNHFVLFRTLQVLGVYGFRGYYEKKRHFLESISFALNNLQELLLSELTEYPYLAHLSKKLIEKQEINTIQEYKESSLTVTIYSFSYKKGIPEDTSGNGGGFVFDCRSIHNPGKYDEYKQLTGLDAPVQQFLENDGEIKPFLEHIFALADASVKKYIERDFTHLMFSFGCTGGQHRSVYSAQKLAEYLHQKFGVKIELIHQEQGIQTMLKNKNN